jgi:exopolysaccharide biosynthesis polyprenyl glycosylphosphotransferase
LLAVTISMEREFVPQSLGSLLDHLGAQWLLQATLFLLGWGWLLSALKLYDESRLAQGGDSVRIVAGCLLGSLVVAVLPLARSEGSYGAVGALLFGSVAALGIGGIRVLGRTMLRARGRPATRNVVIVGSGPRATALHRELKACRESHYNVFGFIDEFGGPATISSVPRLGSIEQLEAILEKQVIDEVCIALPVKSHYESFQAAIAVCERSGVEFSYPLDTFEHTLTRPRLKHWSGCTAVTTPAVIYDENLLFKRLLDVVVSGAMCLLLAAPILAIVLAVKVTSPGPVFFAQKRYGKNKRLFTMYKFRSMRTGAERTLHESPALYAEYTENGFKLPGGSDPRVTPLGYWLRKTSLDELPQLWNVLRGNMSLVGPRPIVPAELAKYGSAASLLLALKPGLTGMWVVEGRSSISYPQRAELELKYVRNWSLLRDLRILARTVRVVLRCDGAY